MNSPTASPLYGLLTVPAQAAALLCAGLMTADVSTFAYAVAIGRVGFFDCVLFVRLSVCSDVRVFFASVQMLVLPVAEIAGPFSELDVCTFSYRLSDEKKKKDIFSINLLQWH